LLRKNNLKKKGGETDFFSILNKERVEISALKLKEGSLKKKEEAMKSGP